MSTEDPKQVYKDAAHREAEVKDLRKRLHAKTERVKELEATLVEANKLINKLLSVPAVREAIREAKAKAEAAEKPTVPETVNPDNANGAADQPSFPAPVQP